MPDNSIDCRILSNFNEIEPLAEEWRALQSRSGTCLFTCFDWFRCWWETMGKQKNRSLHIAVAMKEGRLAGVLPLTVRKTFGLRILEWAGNELFDYCSALAEDDAVAGALWQTTRQSPLYDFAVIHDVRPSAAEHRFLSVHAGKFGHSEAHYTKLEWPTSQAWRNSRSKKQRRDFNLKSKRLGQAGPVTFEVMRGGAVPESVIKDMVRHKSQWCSQRRKKGIFSDALVLQAFQRMAAMAAQQDKLFLATLKCGEAAVSRIFGFVDRGVLHCYFTCYDPAWGRYSPGALLFTHAIGWAIDNGIKEFDFMRGDERFKRQYANGRRELPTYGFSRTPLGACGCVVSGLHFRCDKKAKAFAKNLPPWAQKCLLMLRRNHVLAARAA